MEPTLSSLLSDNEETTWVMRKLPRAEVIAEEICTESRLSPLLSNIEATLSLPSVSVET